MDMQTAASETAAALREANDFQARLCRRTAGITNLVWAIAAPAAMLVDTTLAAVYNAPGWLLATSWIPFILIGIIATRTLWAQQAFATQSRAPGTTMWIGLLAITIGITGTAAIAAMFGGGQASGYGIAMANAGLILFLGLAHRDGLDAHFWSHALGALIAFVGAFIVMGTGGAAILLPAAVMIAWLIPGAVLVSRG